MRSTITTNAQNVRSKWTWLVVGVLGLVFFVIAVALSAIDFLSGASAPFGWEYASALAFIVFLALVTCAVAARVRTSMHSLKHNTEPSGGGRSGPDLIGASQWSDEVRQKSDLNGRGEFAHMLATRINGCVIGQSSTVFGLVGPWGSGKTTLLRETIGQLSDWEVVWFSPWSVGDAASATGEFVAALSEAFPSVPLKESLARYSRFGSPALKLIPIAGDAVAAVADLAIAELSKKSAWHTEFGRLSESVGAQNKRVLVVVDDVDRLDAVELRSLLRVVRLLGRFTNVHYLMAYDQETVNEILISSGIAGQSSDFMEKIVQYPFEVPPMAIVERRRGIRKILDAIDPVGSDVDSTYSDQREELIGLLALGVETPRSLERLNEQIHSLTELISAAEVDVLDFIALTWLRLAHHSVWEEIRLNDEKYIAWEESDTEGRFESLDKLVHGGNKKAVRGVVAYLFEPKGLIGAFAGRRWRINTPRYFARYFQIGLDDDDVSERRIEKGLSQILDGRSDSAEAIELVEFMLEEDTERSVLALDFSRKSRRDSPIGSVEMLHCVEQIHHQIMKVQRPDTARISAVDQWLAREIFLTLKSGLLSSDDLASRFGFSELARGAYAMNRLRFSEDGNVRALYGSVARSWIDDVVAQPLLELLARDDLAQMTYFCRWTQEVEDRRGFLKSASGDVAGLVEIATRFVTFHEWHGSGTHYDLEFRAAEFDFAVGDWLSPDMLASLPQSTGAPSYQVSELDVPEVAESDRRDFAIRSLNKVQSSGEAGSQRV